LKCKTARCNPTRETLADDLGKKGIDSIKRGLKELDEAGWIRRRLTWGADAIRRQVLEDNIAWAEKTLLAIRGKANRNWPHDEASFTPYYGFAHSPHDEPNTRGRLSK
jgi:hypothetical protein